MIEIETTSTDAWLAWEAELHAHGIAVPLPHRHAFARTVQPDSVLLVLPDSASPWRSGCCVQSRELPLRHSVLRIDRLGPTVAPGLEPLFAHALAGWVENRPGALRMDVRAFHPDAARRHDMSAALAVAGFEPAEGGDYVRTLRVDLAADPATIAARLSSSARRNVRSIEKVPAFVAPVLDERWLPDFVRLTAETMERTGGAVVERNWAGLLELARTRPDLARISGLFQRTEPETLIGFACGFMHGDHAEYGDGASTRSGDSRIKIGHPLLWDVMMWARAQGAAWFDLGGVTLGSAGDARDPLGGISDFKRSFSEDLLEVAEEWTFTPSSLRAQLTDRFAPILRRVLRGP